MDPKVGNITGYFSVSNRARGIAVNPVTNKIHVTNADSNSVSVIDGRIDRVQSNIIMGDYTDKIVLDPVTNFVYALQPNNDSAPLKRIIL